MKGLAFRKLSRTSAHRNHLLRNLVTSLFQHERISTTVAKAKEAQREAEKIITKVKRAQVAAAAGSPVASGSGIQLTPGGRQESKARAYIFAREETMPLLQTIAARYIDRPGGYTRLHLHGHRPGDHAPRALLELVDNTKGDLKVELTARAMARELLLRSKKMKSDKAIDFLKTPFLPRGQSSTRGVVKFEDDHIFNELTRLNIKKLLRYQEEEKRLELAMKAEEHLRRLQAADLLDGPGQVRDDTERMETETFKEHGPSSGGQNRTNPRIGRRLFAGARPEDLPASTEGSKPIWQPRVASGQRKNSVVRLGKGYYAKRQGKVNPKMMVGARGQVQTRRSDASEATA